MFQDWRRSIVWLTALAVGGVLALGVWLHPSLALTRTGVLLPDSVFLAPTPAPPLSAIAPTVVVTPTAECSSALAFCRASESALSASATDVPSVVADAPTNSPSISHAPGVGAAAPVPPNGEIGDVVTPTPLANLQTVLPRKGGVPILMYHYVRVNPNPKDRAGYVLSVTPADFAQQMDLLAANGFHTVTMAQVREYVLHGTPLPSKPIALTFDDGYDDAYTAARPVLERYHQTATFFIITGFVNQPRYLTWSQVAALDHEGMEIGSHTIHHPSLPRLSALNLRRELDTSRLDLETHLGHPVLDFCYPGGEYNQSVVNEVARAGYLSATTTRSGVAQRGDNPLELPRLRVWGGETLNYFASVVGQPIPTRR